MNISTIDIFVIVAYLVVCLVVGVTKIGKIKDIRDYAIGDGSISSGTLFATLFATYIGANVTAGSVEKVHAMGLLFVIAFLFMPLGWWLAAYIYSDKIEEFRNNGCLTLSDIMQQLYGPLGKWVSNAMYLMLSIIVLTIHFVAIGYLLHYFTGMERLYAMILGFGIIVLYSTLGGIKAVIVTDLLQSLIIFVALPIACFNTYYKLGGYEKIVESLPSHYFTLDLKTENVFLLLSLVFYSVLPASGGAFIQRFLMAGKAAKLREALHYSMLMTIPFIIIMVMIGYMSKVVAPDINSSMAFFYIIGNELPVFIKGLVIAGMLAVIMSTADSYLNASGVLIAHDIVKGVYPNISKKMELFVARFATVLISLFAALLALNKNNSIRELDWLMSNFWEPLIFIPLAAGFLGFKAARKSFPISLLSGITVVFGCRFYFGDFSTLGLAAGSLASALGLLFSKGINYNGIKRRITNFTSISEIKDHIHDSYNKYAFVMGIFGLIYFLVSSFAIASYERENVLTTLRITSLVLSFSLVISNIYLSKAFSDIVMPYIFLIGISLGYPLLAAYSYIISSYNIYWLINFIIAFIIFIIILNYKLSIFISIISVITAYGLSIYSGEESYINVSQNGPTILAILSFGAMLVMYFFKRREGEYVQEINDKIILGASIAHEMKNILTSVKMYVNTIKEELPSLSPKSTVTMIGKLTNGVSRSIVNGDNTVNAILYSVRKDISHASDTGVYSLKDIVKMGIDNLSPSKVDKKRIQLRALPAINIVGSKYLLSLVVTNVIGNSLKHSGKKSIIQIYWEDDHLIIEDDGIGIDSTQISSISTPFNKRGDISSTGLGLAFCVTILQGMGGDIKIDSKLNQYTKSMLKMPISI